MTATYSLDAMITALTAAGYRVSFTRDEAGHVASVSRGGGPVSAYEHDGIADTPEAALEAAMPEGVGRYLSAMTPAESPEAQAHRDIERAEIWERLSDAERRLDDLEGVRERDMHALVSCIVELVRADSPRAVIAGAGGEATPA